MAVPEHDPVSPEDFLDWVANQEEAFELVDGRVVRMMAGARRGHNIAKNNISVALTPQARRGGCETTTSDTAVRTGANSIRYPDVVVDCGPGDSSSLEAVRPTVVVEVSSPGTTEIDSTDKVDEYQRHDDIQIFMLVDPDVVRVKLYRRDTDGYWTIEKYDELGQVVEMPEIGSSLALREIYAGLEPKMRPALRIVENHPASPFRPK